MVLNLSEDVYKLLRSFFYNKKLVIQKKLNGIRNLYGWIEFN